MGGGCRIDHTPDSTFDRRQGFTTSKAMMYEASTFYFHPDPRYTSIIVAPHWAGQFTVVRGAARGATSQAPVRRRTVARAYANLMQTPPSGLGLGPARGSTLTNPVTSPTRLATEQLVCTCNRCLPPGGSRPGSQCLYSGHPAPINTLAFRPCTSPGAPAPYAAPASPRCRGVVGPAVGRGS